MSTWLLAALSSLALSADAPATPGRPRTGDFKDDYRDPQTNTLVLHYRLRAPEKLPSQPLLGLIVCFHGLHSNEDSLTGFAIGAAGRVGVADQYVIAGGKSKGDGWAETDDKDVLAWIGWVMKTYPIDPRRVHAIGMSNGGGMVKRFGWRHQDIFATVTSYCGVEVPFSGSTGGKPPAPGPSSAAETKTEWYLVHGNADKTVGVETSRAAVKQLRAKGYRCLYREIEGGDHVGILGNADVADDVIRFIHATRHKEVPLSKEEKAALASMASKVKSGKPDEVVPLLAELERIGGAPGGHVLLAALANPDAGVKKATARAAETTAFGREGVLALVKALKDKSDEVKSAAYGGLAAAARLGSPEAEEVLLRAARTKATPLAERVLAIEGLGKAVKLDFLGGYQDKSAIWTLVLLLEDGEPKVREAAFAQVEKAVADTFQYKPDLPAKDLKAAALRWKTWASARCGPPEKALAGK